MKPTQGESSSPIENEVFLSFRGEETRKGFTGHLYAALKQEGVYAFMDEERLKIGGIIRDNLWRAIEGSSICIPIISKGYADSKWCLAELAKMVQCEKKIIPIFYHVDPSDVRHQKGTFQEAFRNHERKFDAGTVREWRKALREVGEIKGYDLDNTTNGDEAKLVQMVVKRVLTELQNVVLDIPENLVGIDARVEDIMELLNLGDEHVRMIGICGMGGIGKTTLAKAVYNEIFSEFEVAIFISDIREASSQHNGLVTLQKQMLSEILSHRSPEIHNVNQGINAIKSRLQYRRILVILDDVDHKDQLMALAGSINWFGTGSRVIITTRDIHVLNLHKLQQGLVYEPTMLSPSESLQLFRSHAFGRMTPMAEFVQLSEKLVLATGGLPLTIEVLGSFLFDKRDIEEWEGVLKKLKTIPLFDVQRRLRISYDGLDQEEQKIFLDIACFYIGSYAQNVIPIWEGCGFSAKLALRCLLHKSLVKIGESNRLYMHDQIRDMGRIIVYEESPCEPGKRSRLWTQEEAQHVLANHEGSNKIEGIVAGEKNANFFRGLLFSMGIEKMPTLNVESFSNMPNLRILQINYINLEGSFGNMPKNLVSLQWHGCPLSSLPDQFNLQRTAVLDLCLSNIVQVWSIPYEMENKIFDRMRVLDLRFCHQLKVTPNFANLPFLEQLILNSCSNLVSIHDSIGHLTRLKILDIAECTSLTILPGSVWNLSTLEDLNMGGLKVATKGIKKILHPWEFHNPENFNMDEPTTTGTGFMTTVEHSEAEGCEASEMFFKCISKLKNLVSVDLSSTEIESLPHSLLSLGNLKKLRLSFCKKLKSLPDSIGSMFRLEELILNGCELLQELPGSMEKLKNLIHLDISETYLDELPEFIGCLENLGELRIEHCIKLKDLPSSIGRLTNLQNLRLARCKALASLPCSVGKLINLTELELSETAIEEFPNSITYLEKLHTLRIRKCMNLRSLPLREMKGLVRLIVGGDIACKDSFHPPLGMVWTSGYSQKTGEYRWLEFICYDDSWEYMTLAEWRLSITTAESRHRTILLRDVCYERDGVWHWGGLLSAHWLQLIFPDDFEYVPLEHLRFHSDHSIVSSLPAEDSIDCNIKSKEKGPYELDQPSPIIISSQASDNANEEKNVHDHCEAANTRIPCFCMPAFLIVRWLCGSHQTG